MRITFDGTVLCDNANRGAATGSGPGDFRLNGSRLTDPADFVRASEGAEYDRGNARTRITFAVYREHASVQDAEYFCLTHYKALSGSGVALFIARSSTGATVQVTLAKAVLKVTDHEYTGATTTHRYEIAGGLVT